MTPKKFTTVALLRRLEHMKLKLDSGLIGQARYDRLCDLLEFDAVESGVEQMEAISKALAVEAAPWLEDK